MPFQRRYRSVALSGDRTRVGFTKCLRTHQLQECVPACILERAKTITNTRSDCRLQGLGDAPQLAAPESVAATLSGAALRAYLEELHDDLSALGFDTAHIEQALQVKAAGPHGGRWPSRLVGVSLSVSSSCSRSIAAQKPKLEDVQLRRRRLSCRHELMPTCAVSFPWTEPMASVARALKAPATVECLHNERICYRDKQIGFFP